SRGATVLVISTRGNAAMLFQAETSFYMRVVGGYINMAITPRLDLPVWVVALRHPDRSVDASFRAHLRQAHVKAILVEQALQPWWVGPLQRMGLHRQVEGGVVVYKIG